MMKGYQIAVSAAQLGLGGGKAIFMQFLSHLKMNERYLYYDRKGYAEILKEQGIIPDLVISFQNIGVEYYEARAAEVIRLSETPASFFPTQNLTPTESSWNRFSELIAQKSVHP